MILDEELLASAKTGKGRSGKRELIKYLKGEKLTRSQAIKANCYNCDCMGDSGKCDLIQCPLYPYSQFRNKSL